MPSQPTINQLFLGQHRQLESELGITRDTIDHSGTMGTETEDKWIATLQKHLPERYAVNRAFVIDSRGGSTQERSQQQDIVIHDRQYSPFVLNIGRACYVPAESVYAILEVKQKLNAEHVKYAAEKVASVRRLHRTSLPIKHAGGEFPAKPPHHILGGIVALESDWSPPFGTAFREVLSELPADGRLDIGCAVRHGVFGVEYKSGAAPVISAEKTEATLALFLLRFIARLQAIATVPCIDVLAYAENMKTEPA